MLLSVSLRTLQEAERFFLSTKRLSLSACAQCGEMTLPCPGGQGALRMCVFDAVCPMGAKTLQSGAPDMGVSRKKAVPPSALPIRGLCRRAGEGEALRALFCGGHGVSALPSAHERRKVHRPASPAAAFFPCRPAGRPAGSARTRPRDQSLGYPFLGNRPTSPPSPRLPKRRRRQVPARGLAAVCTLHRPTRNAKKHPCPLLVGHGCVVTEPKALAAGTAGSTKKQSAHRGANFDIRGQRNPPGRGSFQSLHFRAAGSGRRHWLPWPGQHR